MVNFVLCILCHNKIKGKKKKKRHCEEQPPFLPWEELEMVLPKCWMHRDRGSLIIRLLSWALHPPL